MDKRFDYVIWLKSVAEKQYERPHIYKDGDLCLKHNGQMIHLTVPELICDFQMLLQVENRIEEGSDHYFRHLSVKPKMSALSVKCVVKKNPSFLLFPCL